MTAYINDTAAARVKKRTKLLTPNGLNKCNRECDTRLFGLYTLFEWVFVLLMTDKRSNTTIQVSGWQLCVWPSL